MFLRWLLFQEMAKNDRWIEIVKNNLVHEPISNKKTVIQQSL